MCSIREIGQLKTLPIDGDYTNYIGYGYDYLTGNTTQQVFIDPEIGVNNFTANTTEWNYVTAISKEELDFKLKEELITYSGKKLPSFIKTNSVIISKSKTTTNSVYVLATYNIIAGSIYIPLESDVKDVSKLSPLEFRKLYGDGYIASATLGGKVHILFQYSDVDYSNYTKEELCQAALVRAHELTSFYSSAPELKERHAAFKDSHLAISAESNQEYSSSLDTRSEFASIINEAIDEVKAGSFYVINYGIGSYEYVYDTNKSMDVSSFLHNKHLWVKRMLDYIDIKEDCSSLDLDIVLDDKIEYCNKQIERCEQLISVSEPLLNSYREVELDWQRLSLVPIKRLYNSSIQDHFYTTSVFESSLATQSGYTLESSNFGCIFSTSKHFPHELRPVYRLYSPSAQDHFLTTSKAERDYCTQSGGFVSEGIFGYTFKNQKAGTVPMYRYGKSADHFYNTNTSTKNAMPWAGYAYEGNIGYVFTKTTDLK